MDMGLWLLLRLLSIQLQEYMIHAGVHRPCFALSSQLSLLLHLLKRVPCLIFVSEKEEETSNLHTSKRCSKPSLPLLCLVHFCLVCLKRVKPDDLRSGCGARQKIKKGNV